MTSICTETEKHSNFVSYMALILQWTLRFVEITIDVVDMYPNESK